MTRIGSQNRPMVFDAVSVIFSAGNHKKQQMMLRVAREKGRCRIAMNLACCLILPFLSYLKAEARTLSVGSKVVATVPTKKPDPIAGGQREFDLTEGFYNSSFVRSPRMPIFAFAETDLQIGYMLPTIGRSFYRGNFEGLIDLFAWASTREQSGVLGGGALGVHYNFINPAGTSFPISASVWASAETTFTRTRIKGLSVVRLNLYCKQKRALAYSFERTGA